VAALNTRRVAKDMAAAASGVFKDKWPDVKDYAESEMKKLAESLAMLSRGVAKGTIARKAAKALLGIHKNSAKAVMLTVEGLGLLLVEAAINAAMKVVRDAVNAAAGVAIL
jgi:hypothetical protein